MKKIFLFPTLLLFVCLATAQSYDAAKNLVAINQFQKAKEEFDKGMTNAKYASKPEAYILKLAIYSGLAMDKSLQGTPQIEEYSKEAESAFKKYKELQPDMSLMTDLIYQNGPVNLYASLYGLGYKDYQAKNFQAAFDRFVRVVELSDILIEKKFLNTALDTSALVLAGVTAENSKHEAEAAKYYSRLADKKVGGEGMESIYHFLVNYYYVKGDMPAFEKYKESGKELFPKSEFFTYDNIDFAVGLAPDFDSKMKALDKVLADKPADYKANEQMGMIIYDTLNSRKEGAVLPANADELEKKMVDAFNKSAAAKPGSETPFLYIGDHFISKAVRVTDAKEAFLKEMRTRTKVGVAPAKEDVQKRDGFDVQYSNTLEQAREPYEKAGAIFATKTATLSVNDKQQYKKVASYLSEIYANKKNQAKNKPADAAKYAAEEKKWNDVYESIKLK